MTPGSAAGAAYQQGDQDGGRDSAPADVDSPEAAPSAQLDFYANPSTRKTRARALLLSRGIEM
ncbi:MAG: hypothetical protein AUI15_14135 [Actinobacteria bacterium 13_2_20CM_2_66_6]|nr:MAG: hypothetical protein AUI15_14135 [Actinobacteria bacterium 13_2_20CM_2_66_6]